MNNGNICVSVCTANGGELSGQIKKAEEFADVIEVRFDCMEPQDIVPSFALLDSVKPVLLTFRPKEHGGNADVNLPGRIGFWMTFVRDGVPDEEKIWFDNEPDLANILQWLPGCTVIRSFHDFSGVPDDLDALFDTLSAKGDVVKIACSVDTITNAIPIWKLLERARSEQKLYIPIAMGEAGKWTRILGLAHGAFMTYASLDAGSETAPGQITARDMADIYRVKELDENTGVYGIVGGNTGYSVSPFMHNAAFRSQKMNAVFVPLQVSDLDEFMLRMVKPDTREVELNFKGFSVTNPHKRSIMRHLDFIDETAAAIGAVNTVKIEDGKFYGYNTDAPGFIEPLINRFGDLKGARVAIFGAGGAARACIYALKQEGSDLTLIARDPQKAKKLSGEFDIRFHHLTTGRRLPASAFDIIVNATPLGTAGDLENESIVTAEQFNGVRLVYDLIYNPPETRLMREATAANVPVIGGLEMLIAQGARQFKIWTGLDAPLREMSGGVRSRLGL
ncbi:MAG: shikimate dehydrogenase [Saprospiraceae bacterium]|nr:shikimate dehydrogenase [Pyrinomonadaceae bacterium]